MNAYHDLQVEDGASVEDCKRAYYRLARLHHPDSGGRREDFERIKAAWDAVQRGEPYGKPTLETVRQRVHEAVRQSRGSSPLESLGALRNVILESGVTDEIAAAIESPVIRKMFKQWVKGKRR